MEERAADFMHDPQQPDEPWASRQENAEGNRMIDEQSRRTAYRVRVLPDQLRLARRRLAHMRIEAKRLGMLDLIAEDDASAKDMA